MGSKFLGNKLVFNRPGAISAWHRDSQTHSWLSRGIGYVEMLDMRDYSTVSYKFYFRTFLTVFVGFAFRMDCQNLIPL